MARIPFGEDASDRLTTGAASWPNIPPSDQEFRAPPLGKLTGQSPEEAAAEVREIEAHTRERLHVLHKGKYDYSTKIEYGQLPYQERIDTLSRLQDLYGFSSTPNGLGILDQGFGPRLVKGFGEAEMTGDSPYGFIPTNILDKVRRGEEVTAQDVRYATIFVQHDMRSIADTEAPSSVYRMSGRQYSQDQLEAIAGHLNESARTGRGLIPESYTVADIESPSLDPEEDIWQIAVRRYHRGELRSVPPKVEFPNNLMKTGVVGPGTKSVEEMMGVTGPGPDRLESFKGLLQEFEKGDWNIVGHNIGFDYGMLIPQMKKLPQYDARVDPEFFRLVNRFEQVFKGETHKIIDTNLLAGMLLRDKIELAPELKLRAVGTPVSMENILLQTDLIERMVREGQMSAEEMTELLGKGTHQADIDVRLEDQLLQYLNEMFLGFRDIEFKPLTGKWRQMVLQSRPYGPRIDLDPSNVHPELAANLHRLGMPDLDMARITPQEQMILLSRLQGYQRSAGITVDELPRALGMYRRTMANMFELGGGFRMDAGAAIPSFEEFGQMQREMSGAGVPFAGLNYIERQATSLVGRAAFGAEDLGGELGGKRAFAHQMGDYLGEAWFKDAQPSIFRNSRIISLPPELLEEIYGEGAAPVRTFSLSPFAVKAHVGTVEEEARPATKDVGLMFNFSRGEEGETELQKMLAFFNDAQRREAWGINPKLATAMVEQLKEKGVRAPIQVGSFNRGRGGPEAEHLADTITRLLGVSVDDTSDQKLALGVAWLPQALRERVGEYSRYGPVVMRKGFTPELHEQIIEDVKNQRAQSEIFGTMSYDARAEMGAARFTEAAGAAEGAAEGVVKRGLRSSRGRIEELNTILYGREKKFIGGAALVGAVAVGGYYLHRRHESNKRLDETIAEQDYEEGPGQKASMYADSSYIVPSSVSSAVPFSGNGNARRSQYMQTAGVVSSADRNKIGHHRMGKDRYDHLYGR